MREWCEKQIEPPCIIGAHIEKDVDEQTVTFVKKIYPYEADKIEEADYPTSCDVRYLE